MADTLRVLYVDDEPGLLAIAKLFLERRGAFSVDTLTSAKVALEQLDREPYDAIISDYQMPEMDGIQFLVEVRARLGPVPFILFTGRGREEVVIQAINSGADFYLQKGGDPGAQFAELAHKIQQAASRKKTDAALRTSEEKYRHLIEHSNDAIVVAQDGMLRLINCRAVEFTGYSEQELLSMSFSAFIHPNDRAMVVERYTQRLKGEVLPSRYRFRLNTKDGSTRWVEIGVVVIDWEGRPATLNFLTDITERKQAEEALSIQHDLALVLNQCTNLNDAFDQILSAALRIEGLDVGGIYMADPATGALDVVAHRGLSPEFIAHTSHFDVNSPQVQRARTGIPYYGRYAEIRQPEKDEIRDTEQVTALASLPVMHVGELIAILNLASRATDEVPLSTRHTLETLAMQVGSALVRIRSRKALEDSEERYRHVVEDQTEFICRFLPDGTHIFVNEAYCRYFGLDREKIRGTRFRPVIHPGDRENVARLITSLSPDHQVETIDQRIIMPDSSIRWQRWVDRAIFHADGSLKEYQSVGRDITEYKQAEEALRQSEEQLHLAIDGANLGLWDMDLHSGEMVHNQRWAEMLGFSMNELEKPSAWWGQRVHPDDYQAVLKLNQLHQLGKTPFFDAVYRMKHKNGEWRWVHSQGKVISWDSTGAPHRLIGINQDITERRQVEEALAKNTEELHAAYEEQTATEEKLRSNINELTRAEQALRESEERLNFAIESAHLGLWDLNVVTHELVHNRQWTEMLGFSGDEMDKPSGWWQERVHPDDLAAVTKSNVDHLSGITPDFDCIYRMKHKNGEWRWIHTRGKVISRDTTGVPAHMIGINQDITERRQVEEALFKNAEDLHAANEELTATGEELRQTMDQLTRNEGILKESEEKYRTVFENTGTATVVIEESGIISLANEEFAELSGFPRDAIEGKKIWTDFVVKEDLERMLAQDQLRRQNNEEVRTHHEFRFVSKSNDIRTIHFSTNIIPGTKKSIASLLDITGRKEAEEELIARERSYRTLAENLPGIVYRVHIREKGRMQFFNNMLVDLTGYNEEELTEGEVSSIDWLIVAKDRDRIIAEMNAAIKDNRGFSVEYRITRKDGEPRDFIERGRPVFDDEGLTCIDGIIQDITGQKRVEEDLRENEEKFRVLSEQSMIGIGIIQDGIYQYFNQGYCAISGYSASEVRSWKPYEYAKAVHPDDLDFVMDQVQKKQMNSPEAIPHYSFHAISKDGTIKLLDLYSRTIVYRGRPADFVTFIDITERKTAEEALRQANRKLNLLSSITRHDINNQLTMQIGYLELLEDSKLDPSQNEYFQKISNAASRISAMIRFTKEYEGIGVHAPAWQDCRTLVDTVAVQVTLGTVNVNNDLPGGTEVFADPLIARVCFNLMDNAVRYGGKITTIRFSALESGDDHLIVGEDDGVGVPAFEKEKIFDRGFGKNTGLGLALSREILDITGITIRENGELGKGARFEMTVPKGAWRHCGVSSRM